MYLRIRLQKGFWTSAIGLSLLGFVLVCVLAGAGVFTYYYIKYSRMIDQRLSGGVLQNTTQIFSAPLRISPGDSMSAEELASYLQRTGYRAQNAEDALGQYTAQNNTVDIRPSKASYFAGGNALEVRFAAKTIQSIRPLAGGGELGAAEIEPELITNLFDSAREKRRTVRYDDFPKTLVNAILSAEDKRFFEHPGFDPVRIQRRSQRIGAEVRVEQHDVGADPRCRKISSLVPAALILPALIATASTNDGARLLAIFALCRMMSAGMETSFAAREPQVVRGFVHHFFAAATSCAFR